MEWIPSTEYSACTSRRLLFVQSKAGVLLSRFSWEKRLLTYSLDLLV